jgi:predicted short-subunit dehydrogenase-like oxidoreductase (DUF2520 family)
VGAGKAGTAVAAALRSAGHEVAAVASRTRESAAGAAARLGAAVARTTALPGCDVVLLGVPESAVRDVAEELAPRLRPGTVVWHLAGSLGTAPLAAVGDAGGWRCALHPVQPFPDAAGGTARLPGSAWGVTCDEAVAEWARAVVEEDLGGRAFGVSEADRPVWHAASVTTANGAVALLSLGERLLGAIGVRAAGDVLGPLAAAALAHASERGATASLTGPAVRGEWQTVTGHVEALRSAAPELVEPYLEATRLIFRAAEAAGKVSDEARRKASTLLGDAP